MVTVGTWANTLALTGTGGLTKFLPNRRTHQINGWWTHKPFGQGRRNRTRLEREQAGRPSPKLWQTGLGSSFWELSRGNSLGQLPSTPHDLQGESWADLGCSSDGAISCCGAMGKSLILSEPQWLPHSRVHLPCRQWWALGEQCLVHSGHAEANSIMYVHAPEPCSWTPAQ